MKEKYMYPVIKTEELSKKDILCASNTEVENNNLDYTKDRFYVTEIPGMGQLQ